MNKIYRIILIASCLLSGIWAARAYNPESGFPVDPNLCYGKLPNGFTYYIRSNQVPEGKVELRLVVNIGSIMERDDEQGLSHFLEHMAFNGSPQFPDGQLIKRMESIGVRLGQELNAYTSFDETVYSLPIPSENIDMGLAALEDWAMNLTLDSVFIDKERGVILEELRLGQGASVRIREKYLPVLFEGSLYPCRLPIGKAEVLESFPYERLRNYYKRWYRPDLMAIVAVGDIDTTVMKSKVEAIFGKYPASPANSPERFVSRVPDHEDFKVVFATDPETSGTSVELSYKHSPKIIRTQQDYLDSEVLDKLFYTMMNARLSELLRGQDAPFSDVEIGYSSYFRGVDTYSCYARCAQGDVAEALKAMVDENTRVAKYGFSASELERAKEQLLSRYKRMYNERLKYASDLYADQYQVSFLTPMPSPGIEFEYELVKQLVPTVTLEQVNGLIDEYMTDRNRTIVVTGPAGEGIVYPDEAQLRNIVNDARNRKVKPYREGKVVKELIKREPKAGTITGRKYYPETEITEWRLSNGATVVFKPTEFKSNQILFRSTSNGGFSMYDAEDDMSALYATRIQDESGVAGINNTQLMRYINGKSISITQSLVLYNESMSGRCEPDDAETLLQLVYLYHTEPYFDRDAFRRVMASERADYAKLLDSPQNYFGYRVDSIMSNGNPRRKRWPVASNLDQVRFDRARKIYGERFGNAAGFTFIFVGNVDMEKLEPLIIKYIGGIEGDVSKKRDYSEQHFTSPEGPMTKEFTKGVDQRVNISVKYVKHVPWDKSLAYEYSAFVDILNNRLFESLRRRMSGVYGVSVSGSLQYGHEEEAQLNLSFGTNTEVYKTLVEAAADELERLMTEGPTEEELETLKQKRRVALTTELKENASWLVKIQQAYRNGMKVDSPEQLQAQIENLTCESVREAGMKSIDLNKRLQFTLLPEKAE